MKLIAIFVIGAVIGTAFDYIHVYFGVLSYAHPHFAGTSLWVPVEFGAAGALGCFLLGLLSRRLPAPPVTRARVGLDVGLLLGAYLATGFLVGHDLATALTLLLLVAVSVGSRWGGLVVVAAVLGAITGPLGEALVVNTGFFRYNYASLVPSWLPLLWMVGAGLILDVASLISAV